MEDYKYDLARGFVYRNARPLELSMWQYEFYEKDCNQSAEEFFEALKTYQNLDGGFGHGIEPDFWNPNSSPIATWCAITKLKEVGIDSDSKVVQGILRYLGSGKDFSHGKWHNVIPTNNDYPHAVWWHCNDGQGVPSDNPTVSLAGFVLLYGDKSSVLYKMCKEIAKDSVKRFIEKPTDESHTLYCYLELYEYCDKINDYGEFDLFDLDAFRDVLFDAINNAICKDTSKWMTEYVCKPSTFFDKSRVFADIFNRELCMKECDLIIESIQSDGTYPVPWIWHNDYPEYHIAKNVWKTDIIRKNLQFLKYFGRLCEED